MGLEFDFAELEDALSGISKKVSEQIIDKALDSGAKISLKAMEKNVPIDTEALKNSLGEIKKEGNKINRKVHLGSTSNNREIVARAYYQEYGNSNMNGKKWMKKSYYQSKDEAIKAKQTSEELFENSIIFAYITIYSRKTYLSR